MRLALIGTGAMGRMVEARSAHAAGGGHEVVLRLRRGDAGESLARRIADSAADVVIDFSSAEAVLANVSAATAARRPIVVGTTGWQDRLEPARQIVQDGGGAMVYGANFSVGVNVYYRLARAAAEMLARAGGYEPFVEEQHHSRKKDAPSGTAVKLRQIVADASGLRPEQVSVASTRAGQITGTHRVGFDGAVDQIVLTHAAKSREGFADGAIVAARWILSRPAGVYEFDQVIDDLMAGAAAPASPKR